MDVIGLLEEIDVLCRLIPLDGEFSPGGQFLEGKCIFFVLSGAKKKGGEIERGKPTARAPAR